MNGLGMIFFVEIFRTIVGFTLLIFEINRLKSSLSKKPTLLLLGILIFYNLIFTTRAIGIASNNSAFRKTIPALSALISAIFLILWGSIVMGLSSKKVKINIIFLILGIFLFFFGTLYSQSIIMVMGIALFSLTMIYIIYKMVKYVFRKSPYLMARYRIFLMTMSIMYMIILEGLGVISMGNEEYTYAVVFFCFEILGRFSMSLSIFLPNRIKEMLSKIIV